MKWRYINCNSEHLVGHLMITFLQKLLTSLLVQLSITHALILYFLLHLELCTIENNDWLNIIKQEQL
jgi:hypothetical protein